MADRQAESEHFVFGADVSKGSLTSEQIEAMEDALTRHYGERVAPVSAYCQGFYDWQDAIAAKVERLKAGTEYSDRVRSNYGASFQAHVDDEIDRWQGVLNAFAVIAMPLGKSSMLGRRVYGGEQLRTEMCPRHHGQWHGLDFHGECECHLTGWLPAGGS